MDKDGNGGSGGVGTFVTRVEFNEYKEHQDTRYITLYEKIESEGKAHRLAIWYVGGIISILTLSSIVLSYLGVI